MSTTLLEAPREKATALERLQVEAGAGCFLLVPTGQILRLVDRCGNQSADMIIYRAHDTADRYSAQRTAMMQRHSMIGLGTRLYSAAGKVLMTVVADTCGDHDTFGSGCSGEGNQVRYGDKARFMHSCRDTFLRQLSNAPPMSKRDQVCNLNFFTRVELDESGRLEFVDGVSGPGKYIDLRAETDVLVLLSCCSQLNNPCNNWNPTPIEMMILEENHV